MKQLLPTPYTSSWQVLLYAFCITSYLTSNNRKKNNTLIYVHDISNVSLENGKETEYCTITHDTQLE